MRLLPGSEPLSALPMVGDELLFLAMFVCRFELNRRMGDVELFREHLLQATAQGLAVDHFAVEDDVCFEGPVLFVDERVARIEAILS